jgi:hypothetical protein
MGIVWENTPIDSSGAWMDGRMDTKARRACVHNIYLQEQVAVVMYKADPLDKS